MILWLSWKRLSCAHNITVRYQIVKMSFWVLNWKLSAVFCWFCGICGICGNFVENVMINKQFNIADLSKPKTLIYTFLEIVFWKKHCWGRHKYPSHTRIAIVSMNSHIFVSFHKIPEMQGICGICGICGIWGNIQCQKWFRVCRHIVRFWLCTENREKLSRDNTSAGIHPILNLQEILKLGIWDILINFHKFHKFHKFHVFHEFVEIVENYRIIWHRWHTPQNRRVGTLLVSKYIRANGSLVRKNMYTQQKNISPWRRHHFPQIQYFPQIPQNRRNFDYLWKSFLFELSSNIVSYSIKHA